MTPDISSPEMRKYLLEVDQYRAFLAGQNNTGATRPKAMARYIDDWERKWEHLTGEGGSQGKRLHICFSKTAIIDTVAGKPKL